MSNQDNFRSEVLYAFGEIEKEVIRVLGKYQTSVATITDIETFHNYVLIFCPIKVSLFKTYHTRKHRLLRNNY